MNKTMMLIRSAWENMQTFRLIPTDLNCPYSEAIWNPQFKVLIIIGKYTYEKFHFVPRISEKGFKIPIKDKKDQFEQQRVTMNSPMEYTIMDKAEQEFFIKKFAENEESFNYQQFLNAEIKYESSDPNLGKSEGGPVIKTLEQIEKES